MHERRASVTSSLPDDGTGMVQVYRVKGFQLEELPPKSHGVFYSGDCYVILYTYLKNSRDRHIIYFWLVSLINILLECSCCPAVAIMKLYTPHSDCKQE